MSARKKEFNLEWNGKPNLSLDLSKKQFDLLDKNIFGKIENIEGI